ncbi:MAG: DUF488 domain-containing protein [Actinomycetota bacterium]|nr:DUF488 domain-containing protein [Actinomycetota bacterium]
MPEIATIGVYCFTAEAFLDTLQAADVRRLIDVRQRRGVRGPHFTWANAIRLQALLAGAGVAYSHHRELAPTTALRQLQYREDHLAGVGKRSREHLAPAYVQGYVAAILDQAPLELLLDELPDQGRAALFCVECAAGACHRSLIAQRLRERHGFSVLHLTPPQKSEP